MNAVDLLCGAGGATHGLQQAGFHVLGVDLHRQPNYCGDALIRLLTLKGFGAELAAAKVDESASLH